MERANKRRLGLLPGPDVTFPSIDSGKAERDVVDRLCEHFIAPKMLVIRVGAQVMCTKNLFEEVANGTMGKVVGFVDPGDPDSSEAPDLSNGRKPEALVPLVDFLRPGGGSTRYMLARESWAVELPDGSVQAQRLQVSHFSPSPPLSPSDLDRTSFQ